MKSNKTLAIAALAGLMTVGAIAATPAFAATGEKSSCQSTNGCTGHDAMGKDASKTAEGKEKHACKGLKSCKGEGADGKNACKGHGSCATDSEK